MRAMSRPRRLPDSSSELVILVRDSVPSIQGRVMGRFELPAAAAWGYCDLPAGDYKFVVPAATSRPWVYVRGDEHAAILFAASSERAPRAPMSELRLVHEDGRYRVRSLLLREAARILTFERRRSEETPPEAETWRGILSLLPQGLFRGLPSPSSAASRPSDKTGVIAILPKRPTPQRPV